MNGVAWGADMGNMRRSGRFEEKRVGHEKRTGKDNWKTWNEKYRKK